MENTIEKKVKTKKWQQYIFQIVGVAEQVEEEDEELVISCQSVGYILFHFCCLMALPILQHKQIK